MPHEQASTQKIPVTDPAHGGGAAAEGAHRGLEEWAFVRYVGEPLGEVILFEGDDLPIGRGFDNAVRLDEPEVSRCHALVREAPPEDGVPGLRIEDLGSTNGTFVNGRRIEPGPGGAPLKDGDVVRLGSHTFKVKRMDDLDRQYHRAVRTQTTVDPLTSVSNRATVLGRLEYHFALARRHQRALSVVLCDLDRFKAINDTHGHPEGDRVLQRFGAVLLGRLRGSDLGGRIGGEEFLVVLPETRRQEAAGVAEDLRRALEAEPVVTAAGHELRITCSMGVAELREVDGSGGAMLARADMALYRAKNLGRNRVELDGPA